MRNPNITPLGVIESTYTLPGVIQALTAQTGITDVLTIYTSSTMGGTIDTENTITVTEGRITEWLQTTGGGTPGEWQFDDAVNSGQILTIGL